MGYVISKAGVRLEVTERSLDVRVRFRGHRTIPLADVRDVRVGTWRHVSTLEIVTADGVYEWSFGDRTAEVAEIVRAAVAKSAEALDGSGVEVPPAGPVSPETFRMWLQTFANFHRVSEEEMLAAALSDAPPGTFHSLRDRPPSPEEARAWGLSIDNLPEELLTAMGKTTKRLGVAFVHARELRQRFHRMMASTTPPS